MTSDEKKNNLHLLENTKQYFGLCVTVTPIIDQKKRFHPTTDSPSCPAVPKGTSFTRRYLSRELVLPTKPAFPSIRVHSRRVCIVTKKKKEEEGGKREDLLRVKKRTHWKSTQRPVPVRKIFYILLFRIEVVLQKEGWNLRSAHTQADAAHEQVLPAAETCTQHSGRLVAECVLQL